jgi:hypothetical protein
MKKKQAPARKGGEPSPVKLTISAPGLEALGRDILKALMPSVTQGDIDRMTLNLTRSSDRLAKALKKATQDTHGSTDSEP